MENEKKLDPQVYNEIVNNVGIHSINLMELTIKNTNYKIANTNLSVNLTFTNENYNIDAGVLQVHPQFIVKVVDSNNTIAFLINFTYFIEYNFNKHENIEKEYIKAFVARNVPINIWPYARELVSSLTTRMGFSALVIDPYKG